jgi:hypothetical protein
LDRLAGGVVSYHGVSQYAKRPTLCPGGGLSGLELASESGTVPGIALTLPQSFFPAAPGAWPDVLSTISFFALVATIVLAQVYRYRRVSTPVQRQQTYVSLWLRKPDEHLHTQYPEQQK